MPGLVRDIMHPGLLTCGPETPLGQVAVLLTGRRVHALIVADPGGAPLGLISDFDLLAGEWLSVDPESLAAMRKLTARDLMTAPIDTIEAGAALPEAAQQMLEKQVHRLMVTERAQPVGVISVSDFVASLARQLPAGRATVGDVMSRALLVCRAQTPLAAAARMLSESRWRSIVVVDAAGRPLGVVTGRDLLPLLKEGSSEAVAVSAVMHPGIASIDVRARLHEAANLMIRNHQHRLIVTDQAEPEGFPLGVISSYDIVAEMARPASVWQP